jgi:hypothetical protein
MTMIYIYYERVTRVEGGNPHPEFEAADLAKDANVLWRIITETHLTAVHGVSDSMRVFDQMSLRTRFARLRQKHGVSIGVFKQEYDELKVTLIGAGVPAMPDAEDAMEFLSKLDMVRYGEMFSFLTNRAHLGESFPATLHDAWQVASKWTVSGSGDGKMDASGELISGELLVFTLADEQAPPLRSSRGSSGAETQQEESQEQERALGVGAQSPAAEASRSPRAKSRPAPTVGASRRAIYRRTAPTTAMRRQESWLPSARTTRRMMTSMMSR